MVKNLLAMQETRVQSLEKGMATHSSILAWRTPWTEEPSRLWSMGSHSVRHDWSDWACTHAPTPVLLPGESHGQGSLAGYSPWDRKESDTRACIMFTCKKWIPISFRVKFEVFTEVNSVLQDLAAPVSTPQKITALSSSFPTLPLYTLYPLQPQWTPW